MDLTGGLLILFHCIKGESPADKLYLVSLLFSERQNPRDSPEISTESILRNQFCGFIT
jgi:hypothetical protein